MVKVLLGDVTKERRENLKTDKNNLPVVGLEHLVPQQVQLTEWSNDTDNTFTKVFHKGDILFGRRRAYLKKAVLAPFDGICSGDITVIAPIENKITPELLPFIIQNDAFFDYAVEKSAGSLSPRVKWEHLKNYEFELPDWEEQKKLAKILWAAEETKQAYKNLLQKTDDLIKSQFLELIKTENRYSKISDITKVVTGGTPSTSKSEYWENGNIPWLKSGCCQDVEVKTTNTFITQKGYNNSSTKMMPKDTVMIALTGATAGKVGYLTFEACGNQSITGIFPSEKILPKILFLYLLLQRNKILSDCIGAAQPHISQGYVKDIMVPTISIEKQRKFVDFLEHAEQSKQQLQKSLDSLNTMTKALINENLK